MPTRKKTNKSNVLNYVQKQFENLKQMYMFKFIRQDVEIGANGTSKVLIKEGKNKGKIL